MNIIQRENPVTSFEKSPTLYNSDKFMYEHKNTKYALNIISVIKTFHSAEQLDLHYAMF